MNRLVFGLLLLGACASERPRGDAPAAVRTVPLPPEVEGTDPHRPGGPFDFRGDVYDELPDGGLRPGARAAAPNAMPGMMESPPVTPGSKADNVWQF